MESTVTLADLLNAAAREHASDILVTAGSPPAMKVNGKLTPLGSPKLTEAQARELVLATMNEDQLRSFERDKECNFSVEMRGVGRYRISAFHQRGKVGMAMRRIIAEIPQIDQLGLPAILKNLVMEQRGLILFVGASGSGKSTSLAAMIGHRNLHSTGHILTLEDPIEFDHQHAGCIVTQREIGLDTYSYDMALRNALRQTPDLIMMGEVRSRETMEYCLTFAETGHLCMATLHANTASQALERIVNFFEIERHRQLYMDLSMNLRAVVSQRLIPHRNQQSRVAATEVLLVTPLIADLIGKGEIFALRDVMKRSRDVGMQTFDQAVFDLYKRGDIDYQNALQYADSTNEVRLMIKLAMDAGEILADSAATRMSLQPEAGFVDPLGRLK